MARCTLDIERCKRCATPRSRDMLKVRENKCTNRNIKRSVYYQYGYHSLTFRALALQQRESGFLSDEGPNLETLDYTFDLYLYSAYAAHYTFISLENQCSLLRFLATSPSVLALCLRALFCVATFL